jgi:hypothetical protein
MDEHREDQEVAALLRASRPAPGEPFRAQLERELFEPRRRGFAWPALPRPALAGAALAAALAVLLLALGLIGSSPLSEDDRVRAKDNCRQVTITRVERVPQVVTDAAGETRITYRAEPVRRVITRCTSSK